LTRISVTQVQRACFQEEQVLMVMIPMTRYEDNASAVEIIEARRGNASEVALAPEADEGDDDEGDFLMDDEDAEVCNVAFEAVGAFFWSPLHSFATCLCGVAGSGNLALGDPAGNESKLLSIKPKTGSSRFLWASR
jgi:hypothetical protein